MASQTRTQPQPQAAPQPAPEAQPETHAAPEGQREKKQPVFTWSHSTGSGRIEIAVWDKVVQGENGDREIGRASCRERV